MPRHPKHFVENKDTALLLATQVADVQDEKARKKVERNHDRASTASVRKTRPPDVDKLTRAKERIRMERALVKREKAKVRKDKLKDTKPGPRQIVLEPGPKSRKRVAFA